ncbi:MAG: hypothetical protein ACPIOQ_77330 [Promethearchaeia archaeon]
MEVLGTASSSLRLPEQGADGGRRSGCKDSCLTRGRWRELGRRRWWRRACGARAVCPRAQGAAGSHEPAPPRFHGTW